MRRLGKKLLMGLIMLVVCVICTVWFCEFQAQAYTYGVFTYTISAEGEVTITDCKTSTTGKLIIPETIDGYKVTIIGKSAFSGCSGLTTVNFNAEKCTKMGSSSYPVFKGCSNLTTVNIGSGVTAIPSYAFKGCSGLTSITIPESVTTIGSYVFSGCSGLTSITIPESVTTIDSYVFKDCSGLTSITVRRA